MQITNKQAANVFLTVYNYLPLDCQDPKAAICNCAAAVQHLMDLPGGWPNVRVSHLDDLLRVTVMKACGDKLFYSSRVKQELGRDVDVQLARKRLLLWLHEYYSRKPADEPCWGVTPPDPETLILWENEREQRINAVSEGS